MVNTADIQTIKVLMVDDDEEFTALVAEFLAAEGGFNLTARHDGEAGITRALTGQFDIMILDISMPKRNGFEVLKAVRQQSEMPVIMLTARGDDIDRILGLEIGADDYVPKPCNLRELAARIRAVMRRFGNAAKPETPNDTVTVGDLRLDPGAQSAYCEDQPVGLTGAEYLVLEVLVQSAGQVVDKDAIAEHALGRRLLPYDRSVDIHIGHLRKKLGPLPNGLQRIKTLRGRGYLYVTTG
ncbi:MAG: response regulator [Pseudomonadota bacterium]